MSISLSDDSSSEYLFAGDFFIFGGFKDWKCPGPLVS